ncbi:hypothetical protein [Vagococcus xieshaowenii]|uniref:Uncharacterized protein n=1 Tax=Vagococcus xieshaowenii TaxID=2562451 RepID=A0AAJ5JKY3_9ENTE|nr:hypothetical protein [Vagococcus xieshaowenii]QCA28139.1 hypothetical protein E4Z98_01990 [Vagococcus xieshaowenii]TFZ39734.1 hypothetical protein E4031_08580 [Vagococcus xieshaowenii]
MFPQKKIFQAEKNRDYTADSLAHELTLLKEKAFDDVSYTGLNLNLDMLMSQNIRDNEFKLIQTHDGLAKKRYADWHHDLVLSIDIYNAFAAYTSAHYHDYLHEYDEFEKRTGLDKSSSDYKDYFEQGNSMYFHDVLHSVFDLSRRLDLSINNFKETLSFENYSLSDYPLPEKIIFNN